MILLVSVALGDPCDNAVLSPALSGVENAYLNGQPKELANHLQVAQKALGCDVTPSLAARYHRAHALKFALQNQWALADDHLRAAVAVEPIDPGFLQVSGDPKLLLAWRRAQETGVRWEPAPMGVVNGQRLAARPDTPFLDGSPVATKSSGSAAALRWGAAGLGIVTVGLYSGSVLSRARYESVKGGPESTVVPVYRRTNGLYLASIGTAVLGSGLLGVSFAL